MMTDDESGDESGDENDDEYDDDHCGFYNIEKYICLPDFLGSTVFDKERMNLGKSEFKVLRKYLQHSEDYLLSFQEIFPLI